MNKQIGTTNVLTIQPGIFASAKGHSGLVIKCGKRKITVLMCDGANKGKKVKIKPERLTKLDGVPTSSFKKEPGDIVVFSTSVTSYFVISKVKKRKLHGYFATPSVKPLERTKLRKEY